LLQPLDISNSSFKSNIELGAGKRLRIAVLSRNFLPTAGGAERYSIALVENLADRHDIHVFAQTIDHQWPGVTYHTVPTPLKRPRWINQWWFATATWWATRRSFDVVHSHESTWHGQVQTVHVLPVKYTLFNGLAGWSLLKRWTHVVTSPRLLGYLGLERLRFSGLYRRQIVVTSPSLMSRMSGAYPAAKSALQVLTPGVKLASSGVDRAVQLAARQRLALPELGSCILFVGNDYRKKGLETLISAMGQLPADAWLVVVGSSAQQPVFRAQAQLAGVLDRVFFIGAMNDVSDAYEAADCLAHPTREDTFAMVVLEAMAHGLPVTLSAEQYCGISGLLTHEVHALILEDPRDASALARELQRLLFDPLLRQRLVDAGFKFVSQHQWSSIASQQEEIYYAAASCSPKR
jgi:glycosyltransferase involved in cell wall biosynthesis